VYGYTPVEVLSALYGVALCFFGSYYVVAIAAIEAFRMSGGEKIHMYATDMVEEWKVFDTKNKEDDIEDADGNGTADVLELDQRQVIERKFKLVIHNVNPDKVTL